MAFLGTDETPVVGVLADVACPALEGATFGPALERRDIAARTADAIAAEPVDVWCVVVEGLDSALTLAVQGHGVPALFLAAPSEAPRYHRMLAKGQHDVAWLPASGPEVVARLRGLAKRRSAWTDLTSMICREVAHDLRSPLQALNFLVQAMSRGPAAEAVADDMEMLQRVVETCEVLATSVSNLGHHPLRRWSPPTEAVGPVDVGLLLQQLSEGRFFRGRIDLDLDVGLSVQGRVGTLRRALLDILRVPYQRMPSGGRISAHGMAFGDEVVLRVEAPAYEAFLEHLPAMTSREVPVLLRRQRKPVPFAGLAYAYEAVRASGGSLRLRKKPDARMEIEVHLPQATG